METAGITGVIGIIHGLYRVLSEHIGLIKGYRKPHEDLQLR